MFRNVIVGVDGRSNGRDAVALARLLVQPHERLTLAYIHSLAPIDGASAFRGIEDGDATRMLERERDATAVDAELITVAASSVGRGLHYLTESRGADLLVVGSCDRGFAGRVLVGNDTHACLSGAPCAIAIAPARYADTERVMERVIATVGVGYDGTPESEAALALARQLATTHGATVRALEVVQIPAFAYASFPGVYWGGAFETMLTDAQTRMAGLQGVAGEAVRGIASEELAAFGERVDLLIVGSRGYGPVRRLILGSTSERLASNARCPLLVLTRQAVSGPDQQIVPNSKEETTLTPA